MPEIKDNDKAQNSDITKSPSESLKSSPTKKDVDVTTEALNHFAQGKRHLLVNDITAAVNSLQEACRLLGGHYGEIAPECADAYFYYGKALLELARIETGVLGNALDGVPEGEDQNNSQVEDPAKMTEEESEMVTEIVGEALEENYKLIEGKSLANGNSATESEMDENSSEVMNENKPVSEDNLPDIKKDSIETPTEEKVLDDQEKLEEQSGDHVENKKSVENETENGNTNIEDNDGGKMETDAENTNVEDNEVAKAKTDTGKTNVEDNDGAKIETNTGKSNAEDSEGATMETDSKENENGADQEVEGEDDNEDPEEGANEVESEGEQVEDSDEEIENIHLAWEMLELSKVIYEKQLKEKEDSTLSLKLADVFLKLGELSVERELYNESIQDFNRCLEILTKELKPDDRQLAEIHYQIAVAYSMMHEYEKSIESYEASVKIIEQRMANLAKVIEDKNTWSEEHKLAEAAKQKDPFNSEQSEIDELAKLLPDLQEKISDMLELKHDVDMKIDKLKESPFVKMMTGASNGSGASTSNDSPFSNSVSSVDDSKPVSDIGHLIKKKRKPEEPATVIQVKRAKSENEAGNEASQEKNDADRATKAPELEDKSEESNIETGKSVDTSS